VHATDSHTEKARKLNKRAQGLTETLGTRTIHSGHAAKARGYRTTRNLITMVYLTSGKLDLPPTHLR